MPTEIQFGNRKEKAKSSEVEIFTIAQSASHENTHPGGDGIESGFDRAQISEMNQIPAVADPKGYRTILNCLTNGQFDEPKWRLFGVAGILMASAVINVLFFDKSQLKSNLRLYNYLLGGAFVVSIVIGITSLFLKNELCDKLKSLITATIICLSLYSAIMGITVAINVWKASTGPVRVRPNEPNELQTLRGSDSDEQVRRLNIHEYQGAELMGKFGINVPKGVAVSSLSEIQEAIKTSFPDQNESQILVRGRRLGTFKSRLQGGVHIVKKEEVEDLASKMLGQLITKQTGPQDKVVSKLHLCEKLPLVNEMYFAITLDRKTAGPLIIACSKGGTSIEDLTEKYPDMIIKVPIDVFKGITDEDAAKVVDGLNPKGDDRNSCIEQVKKLYQLFCKSDCTMLEINSIAETAYNQLVAADAELNFDDNAAFRQKDIFGLCDASQEVPREVTAAKADLNYIGLDREIGCTPANFLDVGGDASEGQVSLKVPVVVRLEGTNVDQGKRIIKESGMALITADDLDDAADKAVKAASK